MYTPNEDEAALTIRLSGTKVQVFVGDKQIGLVQSLSFKASMDNVVPEVELKLADVPAMEGSSENLLAAHRQYVEALKKLPAFIRTT